MERVLYNTILGARDTTPKGETFYYSDYSDAASKFYRDELWPCCSGTFIQLAADYGISAYLQEGAKLYVNLYVPSTLSASVGGAAVSLRQETRYPLEPTIAIAVDPARPTRFSLMLRVPAWAGAGSSILVNDRPAGVAARPGTFVTLDRVWRPGDRVEIAFDMTPRLEPLNAAHPEVVALLTGPLVLLPIGPGEVKLTKAQWLAVGRSGVDTWRAGEVVFKPFMAISDERYRLYGRLV